MPEALGVGDHAVAVEEQRRHQRDRRRAGLARRAEDPHVIHRHRLDLFAGVLEQSRRVVLAGVGVEVLAKGIDEGDLQGGRDVHLRAAAGDQVLELLGRQTRAAMQDHRDWTLVDHLGHALGRELRAAGVEPVCRSDGGREAIHPGVLDELQRHLDRMYLAGLVGPDVILDALHAFDLPLDIRAMGARLLDHLGGLTRVLLDVEMRAVEQDGVPAGLQALRGPFALGAVVEMKGDRDRRLVGHRAEHLVQHVCPDGLHGLDRRLDDQGRVELGGGVDHGLQADVVDHVEGCNAVALLKRGIEDLW